MSFLCITVPLENQSSLSKIKVPGEKTTPEELHITLVYFGKQINIKDTLKVIEIVHKITEKTKPFAVETNQISHFPGWEDNDKSAVIAKIVSSELHQFRKQLANKLEKENIDFSKTYKEYRPHITLSYAKNPPEDRKIDKIKFDITEITLFAGEEMDDKLIVKFPLQNKTKNASLYDQINLFTKIAEITTEKAKKILQLKDNFSDFELKNQMRKLVKIHHPDHQGDPRKLDEIIKAYKLLRDHQSNDLPKIEKTISDPISETIKPPWGNWWHPNNEP